MIITVQVDPSLVPSLESSRSDNAESRNLLELCHKIGAPLKPLHPGVSDKELRTFFSIDVPEEKSSAIQQELLQTQGVRAAYIKPPDELP